MTICYLKTLPNQNANDFLPGDFSFMADPDFKLVLTHAYQAVTQLEAWQFFDEMKPNSGLHSFEHHPTWIKIEKALEPDNHSGYSLALTISWLWQIRQKGWQAAVQDNLK